MEKQTPRLNFGEIVVVEKNLVGVVVKIREKMNERTFEYEVYVRSLNGVRTYQENEITKYPYGKEMEEDGD